MAEAEMEKSCYTGYTWERFQPLEADGLKSIVISMQNSLLSGAIARALSERGQFRCQQVAPGRMQEIASVCKTLAADVLLMEVNRFPAAMLEKRLETGAQVRRCCPGCRIVLLCDEVADPELAEQVLRARQAGQIDGFFYASVTAGYLSAALEAM